MKLKPFISPQKKQKVPQADYSSRKLHILAHIFKNKKSLFAIITISVFLLFALFAPVFSNLEYYSTNIELSNLFPCSDHLFGTDQLGRDLWLRVWIGTRISFAIGLLGALIPQIIGLIIGSLSGIIGGRTDTIIMSIVDIGICIPSLVYITLIAFFLGTGPLTVIFAISLSTWMETAKIARSRILQYKNREFILVAKTQGASNAHIIIKHILPNILGQVIISTISSIPNAIFTEAYLSFIGLGILSPLTSLGQLCKSGISVYRLYPYQLLFPGAVISILSLSFFVLGNSMRDLLDPYE